MAKFISNVLKLFTATLLGQIIGIIASPVLSRLYSPEDFGIYQLFFSIASIAATIACLSYHNAINLPKKDEDAANIVALCLLLIAVISVLSAVVLAIFSKTIENVLNAPGLAPYLILIPLAITANSVAYVLGSWLSRRQQFGTNAQANLSSSIMGKTTSIGFGLLSPSPFGLIFGTIINDTTIIAVLLRKTLADFSLFQNITRGKIRGLAIRYKKFPQFSTISALMSTGATQCIPFMLAVSFSPIVVGFYAMTLTLNQLPLKLMGNSIVSVFYQKACAEKNRTGSIAHIVKPVHTRLVAIGIFICLVLMIIGPELFAFVLGARWFTAGVYAQILAPWFFVVFISTPLSSIFYVFEKQGQNLGFNTMLLLTRIVVIFLGGIYGDPIFCMVLLSVTGIIFWSWMNMYLIKLAGIPVKDAVLEILRFLLLGLIISVPILLAKFLSVSLFILFSITIGATMLYYLIVIYQDTQLREGLFSILRDIQHK